MYLGNLKTDEVENWGKKSLSSFFITLCFVFALFTIHFNSCNIMPKNLEDKHQGEFTPILYCDFI